MLAILLEHVGEVVRRDELIRRLWSSDVFVDFDNNLNTAVSTLRVRFLLLRFRRLQLMFIQARCDEPGGASRSSALAYLEIPFHCRWRIGNRPVVRDRLQHFRPSLAAEISAQVHLSKQKGAGQHVVDTYQ